MAKRTPVPKTRCSGTMTEAAFRSWVRSSLRRMSLRWRPLHVVRGASKRPIIDAERQLWGNTVRFVHQCQLCMGWFPIKFIDVDHIIPCGTLADIATDAGPFILRMLCEEDGVRRLCKSCHKHITKAEKDT